MATSVGGSSSGSGGHQVREYTPADWPLVLEWWEAHQGPRRIYEALLPPIGLIVEREGAPIAALWCHLSVGIGVAFLEHPVTRPGLHLLESAAAMSAAIDAMEEICRTHDYGLLIANTLPGIARWLERRKGFQPSGERVQMLKFINHHHHHGS